MRPIVMSFDDGSVYYIDPTFDETGVEVDTTVSDQHIAWCQ